jgi:hypothetical protein
MFAVTVGDPTSLQERFVKENLFCKCNIFGRQTKQTLTECMSAVASSGSRNVNAVIATKGTEAWKVHESAERRLVLVSKLPPIDFLDLLSSAGVGG